MLGAAPVHIFRGVLQACTRCSINLAHTPTTMVCLLQPLDMHTFAICKQLVLRLHQYALVRSETGEAIMYDALLDMLIIETVEVNNRRCWQKAFLQT